MTLAVLALPLLHAHGPAAEMPNVQRMLDDAVRARSGKVVLPKGRIVVDGELRLRNVDGLVIEGNQTTLVFTDPRGIGWHFHSCRNVALRGFMIDYDPLPFIQGRITARSRDGRALDFRVCDGYPGLRREDQAHYRPGYMFEATRSRWKPWIPDLYCHRVEIIDKRRGRFLMRRAPAHHDLIQVGDRIVLTLRTGVAMRMDNCEGVRLEDLTFLAAPGHAYVGRCLRGDNYFRYTIRPGPPPAGATEPRLISACADGLNLAFCTRGPTIEKCRFSFMGDDSINLHGVVLAALGREGERTVLVGWPHAAESLARVIPKGAVVRRLQAGNYAVLGTAKVVGFAPQKDASPEHLAAVRAAWPQKKKARGTVFRLSLDRPMAVKPGEFIDIPANNAPGFVIRDCVFEDHRARGLRIGASHGRIERNVFRRLKQNAITLGAEYGLWREAGWVEDVTIRGNVIEDVGRDGFVQGPDAYALGAISVFVRRDARTGLPYWPGHRDITIKGNAIRDCPAAGIHVVGATDVRIQKNRLENVLYRPGESPGRDAIDVRHASDVQVKDNVLIRVGKAPEPR